MAEGETRDFDLSEVPGTRLEPEESNQITETTFSDDNTQYNTGANLTDEDNLLLPPPPRPFRRDVGEIRRDWEDWDRKERGKALNIQNLNTKLQNTEWSFTTLGVVLVAGRIEIKGGEYFFFPNPRYFKAENMTDKQLGNLEPDKSLRVTMKRPMGKLYNYDGLKSRYGKPFADYFKGLLETQDERRKTPILRPSVLQPPAEQFETLSPEERLEALKRSSMDNEPSKYKPQKVLDESFEKMMESFGGLNVSDSQSGKKLESLIDTNEEELKAIGFSDNVLREWRGMIKASDDLAAVKRDKDMKIEELKKQNLELGKKVNDLVTEYINSTAMEVAGKDEIEKEIDELKKEKAESDKKLEMERKKVLYLIGEGNKIREGEKN